MGRHFDHGTRNNIEWTIAAIRSCGQENMICRLMAKAATSLSHVK